MSKDYTGFLEKYGFADEWIVDLMGALNDPVPNEIVDGTFEKKESEIHGVGMFAKVPVRKDDIFPANINGDRTNIARYTNHSYNPNTRIVINESGCWMQMIKDVSAGQEITVDYEINMMMCGYPEQYKKMCDEFMERKRMRECDAF